MNSSIYYNSDYLKDLYDETVYRIPIDLGFSCPNRNADGSGGCVFCAEHGGRSMQTMSQNTLTEQIETALDFARRRYKAKKFMAYFQAYSAQFSLADQKLYREIIKKYKFKVVTIAARPDSLEKEGYRFLQQFSKEVDLWLELGIQTVHNKTLKLINRGHTWQQSKNAILKLNKPGIKVAVHVIIGLPGENEKDILKTAKTLAKLPLAGIKIHNLHVLKNTKLAEIYQKEKFKTFNEYQYAEILMPFLRHLPPKLPVMRISTDSIKEDILAPHWQMNKCSFLEYIQQQMIYREYAQGDLFRKNTLFKGSGTVSKNSAVFEKVMTADGSWTYWNSAVREHYHSAVGALKEAREKYLVPSELEKLLNSSPGPLSLKRGGGMRACEQEGVSLLDVCFGLGYNSLAALDVALKSNTPLNIYALEIDKQVVGAAAKDLQLKEQLSFDSKKLLSDLYKKGEAKIGKCVVKIFWGDARYTIGQIGQNSIDLIYLDAFSTNRNSELWTVDFFNQLKAVMKRSASLYTYCAAIPVRSGLLAAGFYIGETTPIGRLRGGTVAALIKENIKKQIPAAEQLLYKTPRGIPYRDPFHVWTNKQILRRREENLLELKNKNI